TSTTLAPGRAITGPSAPAPVVTAPGAPGAAAPAAPAAPAAQPGVQQFAGQIFLVPLPRFNAILVAAPKARLPFVVGQIEQLDRPTTFRLTAFALRRAAAARVAAILNSFYATRNPQESSTQNMIRFTSDETTNTLYVQAAPADLDEIKLM